MKKSQRWNLLAIAFLVTSALGILMPQIPRWVAYLSAFCMFVSLVYMDKAEESEAEKTKRKYKCSVCKHEFEAEDPPDTIPASFVFCPECGGWSDMKEQEE